MSLRFLLFFALISSLYNSQNVQILNMDTKIPIENVLFFDKFGNYIGKTNFLGEINKEILSKNSTFILNNPTIKTDTLSLDKIFDDKVLIKQTAKNPVVKTSSDKSNKEFTVLTGYFNVYTTMNGNFQNYIDGIIQYIFDNKTGQYIKQNIKQYRYIKFDIRNFQNQDIPLMYFTGIMQIPSLGNLMTMENSDRKIQKKYIEANNELLIELSKTTYSDSDRKLFGYLFNNFKSEDIFKISGKDLNPSNLLDFNRSLSLNAKPKNADSYTAFVLISNFYPSKISYVNKPELEKGVKIKNNRSNFTTNYWENSCLLNLYNQISPKPTFRSYQLKNK